jgi:hypothetical protein
MDCSCCFETTFVSLHHLRSWWAYGMHWAVIKLYVSIIVRIVTRDVEFVKNEGHA